MSRQRAKPSEAIGFLTVIDHEQHGLFGGYLVLNTAGRPLEFHCTAPIKPSRAQEILYGPTLQPYLYGEQIGQTLVTQAEIKPLLVCTDVAPALEVASYVSMPVLLVDVNASDAVAETAATSTDGGLGENRRSSGCGCEGTCSKHGCDRPGSVGSAVPTDHVDGEADVISGSQRPKSTRDEAVRGIAEHVRLDAAHRAMGPLHWFRAGNNRLGLLPETASQREAIERQLLTVAEGLDLSEPFQRIRQAIDEAQRGGRG